LGELRTEAVFKVGIWGGEREESRTKSDTVLTQAAAKGTRG